MTAVWIVQSPNGDDKAFDTELAAESHRAWLIQSRTATNAVTFPVEVDPPCRSWRKSA